MPSGERPDLVHLSRDARMGHETAQADPARCGGLLPGRALREPVSDDEGGNAEPEERGAGTEWAGDQDGLEERGHPE